ncbi:MAG: UbiA family prenyltransferase [Acidobacteria bacterium]|nr:UbiA family prenyltransferase [Acidobacteriota bacterium]
MITPAPSALAGKVRPAKDGPAGLRRWVVYQRERFPLAGHAPLVAAFSASAVCFSALVRGHVAFPRPGALVVAFITSLLFFLQLRIADEFKDFEEDSRFRPYRPVPRGLVSLRELAWVGILAAAVQLGLALWIAPSIAWLLVFAWVYLALMTREFFVPRWLKAHPVLYIASHMLILPLVDLYATACDWWIAGLRRPPDGLYWFLVVSYLNGIVVEIGRKTRAPIDEEQGVETYSALWGAHRAVSVWCAALGCTAIAAWQAAARVGTAGPMLTALAGLLVLCAIAAVRFLRHPVSGSGRSLEVVSGLWTVLMYLGLGVWPLAWAVWRAS